ncbi:MAG: hypothetical protein QOF72_1956 [Blastocatellia bacterium]|nr:hypothetical protein [Blastocatellia bacterium]
MALVSTFDYRVSRVPTAVGLFLKREDKAQLKLVLYTPLADSFAITAARMGNLERQPLRTLPQEIQNRARGSIGSSGVADLFRYFFEFGSHRGIAIRFEQGQQLARE